MGLNSTLQTLGNNLSALFNRNSGKNNKNSYNPLKGGIEPTITIVLNDQLLPKKLVFDDLKKLNLVRQKFEAMIGADIANFPIPFLGQDENNTFVLNVFGSNEALRSFDKLWNSNFSYFNKSKITLSEYEEQQQPKQFVIK